jgi:hypothetical protein
MATLVATLVATPVATLVATLVEDTSTTLNLFQVLIGQVDEINELISKFHDIVLSISNEMFFTRFQIPCVFSATQYP